MSFYNLTPQTPLFFLDSNVWYFFSKRQSNLFKHLGLSIFLLFFHFINKGVLQDASCLILELAILSWMLAAWLRPRFFDVEHVAFKMPPLFLKQVQKFCQLELSLLQVVHYLFFRIPPRMLYLLYRLNLSLYSAMLPGGPL